MVLLLELTNARFLGPSVIETTFIEVARELAIRNELSGSLVGRCVGCLWAIWGGGG